MEDPVMRRLSNDKKARLPLMVSNAVKLTRRNVECSTMPKEVPKQHSEW